MSWRIPLTEVTLGEEEAQAAADVVRSGWLTQGERVIAFEREVSCDDAVAGVERDRSAAHRLSGVARDGRDLYAQGSIMGIVAREQLSFLSDEEVAAVHAFLQKDWTTERAAKEDAKIATFPPPTFVKK